LKGRIGLPTASGETWKGAPLYPFGYGLSYTKFEYSRLRVAGGHMTVDIRNIGWRDGEEVIQFYARYAASKVERPVKQLVGFGRVRVARGQTRSVTLPLSLDTLKYWDEKQNGMVLEPGRVEIFVGGSSTDTQLKTSFTVN
jgi:beta-glucosidase